MLRELPSFSDPRVLAGRDLADDAGVFRLTDEVALVQTVDFFTPIVDDPYTFGQIAATNALSDIYAMGARPLTALNIVLFPTKILPVDALAAVLRGGADKAIEAEVSIIGGHTVEGEEPAYGLAVTGIVHPNRVMRASTGRPGDVLVLTKPLGTGVISTALKAGMASPEHVERAVKWMTRLNRSASVAMLEAGANACTDITGFGLLGHTSEVARASGLAAELNSSAVPLVTGAAGYAARGFISAGGRTNEEFVGARVTWSERATDETRALLLDPQTSGGLLIATDPDRVADLSRRLQAVGDLAVEVGRLVAGEPGHVDVT